MYRGRLWTMRLYSGWGDGRRTPTSASATCSTRGRPASRVALDLPTQMGYDSDPPARAGEVGKVGVAIDSLADMETIFERHPARRGLDLVHDQRDRPDPARDVPGGRREAGRRPGGICAAPSRTTSSRSSSPARPTSTRRARRCGWSTDVIEYSAADAAEVQPDLASAATTCARPAATPSRRSRSRSRTACAYVEAVVDRGLPVDEFAPRFSFNISTMRDFFEEVAKHRAARRLWARTDPRALRRDGPALAGRCASSRAATAPR